MKKSGFFRYVISALVAAVIMSTASVNVFCIEAAASSKSESAKLSAPKNIKSTVTENKITLTWDKVKGADAYRVYLYSARNEKFEEYKNVSSTKCVVKNVQSGMTYKFKIAALVKNKKSFSVQTKSDTIKVKTLVGKLPATEYLSYKTKNNSIILSWDAVKGADAYRVYKYSYSKKEYKKYKDVTETKCEVTGLTDKSEYMFKVAPLIKNSGSYVVWGEESYPITAVVDNQGVMFFKPSELVAGESINKAIKNAHIFNCKLASDLIESTVRLKKLGIDTYVGEGYANDGKVIVVLWEYNKKLFSFEFFTMMKEKDFEHIFLDEIKESGLKPTYDPSSNTYTLSDLYCVLIISYNKNTRIASYFFFDSRYVDIYEIYDLIYGYNYYFW